MSDDLREQIYNNLSLKETDELLAIWRTNNRVEWSDSAFEIVKELLSKRGAEIPEQDEPIYEYGEEFDDKNYGFDKIELKIIDDENPPEFYDPIEALQVGKWLDLAAKAMIALTILGNIFAFQRVKDISSSYFPGNPDSIFIYILAVIMLVFNVVFVIPIYYFPLQALSHILRILMEMEFNS